MDYKVLSKDDVKLYSDMLNFTSLKGYVRTTFKDLCLKLGPPTYGPYDTGGDKVTCEWKILTDKMVVTIYDWKTEETPMDEYDWHVGGHMFDVIDAAQNILKKPAWRWK